MACLLALSVGKEETIRFTLLWKRAVIGTGAMWKGAVFSTLVLVVMYGGTSDLCSSPTRERMPSLFADKDTEAY